MNETAKKIELVIKGFHIPAKKNSFYQGVKGRILIDQEVKERVERITNDFVSQLLSFTQTNSEGTETGLTPLSRTVSLLPEDDSWTWIPEHSVKCVKCEKGNEGCHIIIEEIT